MSVVHVRTPDGLSTGAGTTLTSGNGEKLFGVKSAIITIDCKRAVSAELELSAYCDFEGEAQSEFYMLHPVSGVRSIVKKIVFEDGTEWSPE